MKTMTKKTIEEKCRAKNCYMTVFLCENNNGCVLLLKMDPFRKRKHASMHTHGRRNH